MTWYDVTLEVEFPEGEVKLVEEGEVLIAVFNLKGQYYAVENNCTHNNVPMLGYGIQPDIVVKDDYISCPRHGARFCIKTGAALTPPAYDPLTCFEVRIENGMVQVQI